MDGPALPPPGVSWLGLLLRGWAAALALAALALGLRLWGASDWAAVMLTDIAALALAVLVASERAFPGRRGLRVAAILAIFLPPMLVVMLADAPLLGTIREGSIAAAIPDVRVAGDRFTDAGLRRDAVLDRRVSLPSLRGGRPVPTRYFLAPIVPEGWTPAQPVRAWALAFGGAVPAAWAAPGGLLRDLPRLDIEAVLEDALAAGPLRSLPDPVIGRWVPDPGAARNRARLWLGLILAAGLAGWGLVVWRLSQPVASIRRGAR
jgi:hypothetical protein